MRSAVCVPPYSNVVSYHTGPPQQANIKRAGKKWDRRREERRKIEEEEFATYDRVCQVCRK
jgi:hypothetical protein